MKIKFKSDSSLSLMITLKLVNIIIVFKRLMKAIISIHKFSEMNVCTNYKCYSTIGKTCLKELMLIKPMNYINVLFRIIVIIIIFLK